MPSMFSKKYSGLALLQLLSAASVTFAHPGGVPRLMGRNGYIDIRDLPDLTGRDTLVKRVVSPDGTCGGTKGYTCGTSVNKCCSQYGYCGDTDLHCQSSENCQAAFGICTTTPSTGGAGRCGTQGGGASCATGQCCSEGGYCGTTADYCMAPLCQVGFGKCDADTIPSGASTSTVARPKVGSVLYGAQGVYACNTVGEVALTYDDGPDQYTSNMLDLLASYNAKATFFITGINNGKGAIDTTPAWKTVIQKMYAAGHQLASHTWSHADLSAISETRRRDEMIRLEMAMRNIVGFFPTYMRPPYSSCTAACQTTMADLGYHIIYFDLDTDDYNNVTPALINNAVNNFNNAVNPSNPATKSWLAIAHDIHPLTATTLTQEMLKTITAKGYKAVTVGKCLGDPEANWYRGSATPPTSTTTTVTTPPATTITTSTTSAPPTSTGTCTYKVGTWCGAAIPSWTTTAGCWTAVGNCWDQGDLCWNTDDDKCSNYQNTCVAMESYCQACADSGATNCAYKAPTYPTA